MFVSKGQLKFAELKADCILSSNFLGLHQIYDGADQTLRLLTSARAKSVLAVSS